MMMHAQLSLLFALLSIMSCCFIQVASTEGSADPFNLHVQIDLHKGEFHFNCSMAALSDLENEVRDWIDDELHAVLGSNAYDMPQIVGLERHDTLQVSALIRCTNGCRHHASQTDDDALQGVAKTLQWSAGAVIRQWYVDAGRLLDGCMGDSFDASVTVKELDFDLEARIRHPVVLGLEDFTNSKVNATATEITANI